MSEKDGRQELLHIGVVAERTDLSLRTLRHYDEIGLVTPSERSEGGFRLYSEQDVDRILLIRRMKPLDFTLEQMRELLDVTEAVARPDAPESAHRRLREFEETAIERRRGLEKKVAMADEFLARLGDLSAQATRDRTGGAAD
ncbi:MerR family transcriptional regulator [Brachybacterium sp. ACRRE]|uniref:MerR family transcriptional regulator n=1 Tax=Brachybacterium sp. ACRRE TaxID=2918184 RepID=UPI001EF1AFB7|nr:MerR family transcriptional regulator [Brachybacterium sp. ACRRE]MCG7311461.1 MerR family transcriptional regulator [Brachybacterium sp. ACRRE]